MGKEHFSEERRAFALRRSESGYGRCRWRRESRASRLSRSGVFTAERPRRARNGRFVHGVRFLLVFESLIH